MDRIRVPRCALRGQQSQPSQSLPGLVGMLDANGDGKFQLAKVDDELQEFANHLDSNGDRIISIPRCLRPLRSSHCTRSVS